MVQKAVTHQDLQNLEIRVKSEIREQEKNDRHNLDTKLQDYYLTVDELDKKSAVNDNIIKNMSTNFKEMKESFDKLSSKIETFPDKFATKEDHKENVQKISAVEKALDNINLKIAGVSGGFAVIIFLIDKYAK